ncbi:nucleoside triphosphate pyrophosphohydrolase family protein [Actinobacillus equuli]|uniref:Phosphoribosyl-ATP pyrophosphohydrolase n=1 Tax=Actinobacillus equuli TaxID=718 RepID=A0AAX3FLN3_ACTEU|nr:nucleoside triphosphate pyrophosphohydrolase family protein [Actinobacillus equuli]WGE44990.1 nucleoside triphosphate pyrophosphohydrolase family protein [Actinobacillus equuli subsp. equuli]VEE92946.1 Phosphoribosyl-ATP pyrophosphohydrolase [Actinobacillus equuli]
MNENTINQIANWFKTAVPNPTAGNKCVQIGCHFEEACEMMNVFCTFAAAEELYELSEWFKRNDSLEDLVELDNEDKVELLDALCDQIVTAIGVAHMFGMDIQGALQEVANSNDSKFEDGSPVFNEHGNCKG